ncbi:hypothetical protein ABAC460_12310 [Asticcacaulis sp. AC460]|uniref:preprotein translocase subunit SecG n=1 Tax=Asticcacaulis sp. AC460 TaxID=1282360 RepID=UPI0003C3BCAA|nr:preprotein translocase subunit SecG [Asticcacaulis sp. AC460]ESQ89646.1 hypothetical protein ABAC460_12310 [Asticcacaulis sp. AC460]
MLFGILLTIQIIICLALGGLVLIQRSEGGALGVGGGPSGFMSARGAGNLLTRATSILGFLFFACAIGMTVVGNLDSRATRSSALQNLDTSGLTVQTPATQPQEQQQAPAAAQATSSAPSLSDLKLGTPTSSSAPASQAPVARPSASASSTSSRTASPSASAPAPAKAAPSSSSTTTSPAQ